MSWPREAFVVILGMGCTRIAELDFSTSMKLVTLGYQNRLKLSPITKPLLLHRT